MIGPAEREKVANGDKAELIKRLASCEEGRMRPRERERQQTGHSSERPTERVKDRILEKSGQGWPGKWQPGFLRPCLREGSGCMEAVVCSG